MHLEIHQRVLASLGETGGRIPDVSSASDIITKIALERIPQERDISPRKLAGSVVLEYEKRLQTLIKEGFPFSQVSDELGREALSTPFIHLADVIIHMLKNKRLVPEEPGWNEMQTLLKALKTPVLAQIFKCESKWKGNQVISYSLHILVKMLLIESYPLPKLFESCFSHIRLTDYLFQMDFKTHPDPLFLIELIFLSENFLLENINKPNFLDFVLCHFYTVPFSEWPHKGKIITEYLKKDKHKIDTARYLVSCKDPVTVLVGMYIHNALLAKIYSEKYSYIYQLLEILDLNEIDVRLIFDCPFISFLQDDPFHKDLWKDPEGMHRLSFDGSRKVYIIGNLMIGFKKNADQTKTIYAFDITTHHLKWALPLQEDILFSEMCSLGMAFAYKNNPFLHIYNPGDGRKISTIRLPMVPENNRDRIHITPSGFCYFRVREGDEHLLYGAQISNGTWKQAFKLNTPSGSFVPLGNYLWFKDKFDHNQRIFNQDGTLMEINCNDLLIKNGHLYTLKRLSKEDYKITIQSLEDSPSIQLKDDLKEFSLKATDLTFKEVCDDGTIIALQWQELAFIDVVNKKMTLLTISYTSLLVDTKKTVLWTWQDSTKTVYKHSPEVTHPISSLQGDRGLSLVHVHEQEIYFLDIPY